MRSHYRKINRLAVLMLITAASLSSGCTTTNHTDPSKVSICDLWCSDRLDQYIKSRELDLIELKADSVRVSRRLGIAQVKLVVIEQDLLAERNVERGEQVRLNNFRLDVKNARETLEIEATRSRRLEAEIVDLKSELADLETERDAQLLIATKQVELEQLEQQIGLLERTIEQTVIARAKHGSTTL